MVVRWLRNKQKNNMKKAEAVAKLRHLRMSPRKIRLLVDLVRGLKVEEAIIQLENSQKAAARPLLKLLQSSIANAKHNHDLKEETLVVKTAFVDGGPILHRWIPRAMGRATPIRKRSSHITLVLEGEVEKKKKVKKEKKTEEKAASPVKETKKEEESTEQEDTRKLLDKETEKNTKGSFFNRSNIGSKPTGIQKRRGDR